MKVTQKTLTTTTIELNDTERFQLSRILDGYRMHAWEDSPDYRLSLELSRSGIDRWMTERQQLTR